MKFWLDALKWNKAERLGQGKVKIFLSAPNHYYANFIDTSFRKIIETAVTQVLGESCEVSIDVDRGMAILRNSLRLSGDEDLTFNEATNVLLESSVNPIGA